MAIIRNCLMAALRNMGRSPVQSAIIIVGLAIGLWAAILAGIIAANQTSYDNFIPGSRQLFLVSFGSIRGSSLPSTPHDLASDLLSDFPQVQAATRIAEARGVFTRGDINSRESFYWADPNFFRILKLPGLYGDPATALKRPDAVVITRAVAQKYFSRDDARGQTLLLDHQHPLQVVAVIADPPVHATNLEYGIFVSALAPFSNIARSASRPSMTNHSLMMNVATVVRLAANTNLFQLEGRVSDMVSRLLARPRARPQEIHFLQLSQVHLSPLQHPGDRTRLAAYALAAGLILFLACVNFVNLSVACSARRAVEVGIRKVTGASQGALILQFLGESILQVILALCVAIALVEWTLPLVNSFLQSGAEFAYWRDPVLLGTLLIGAILVGVAAGIYPAFILSSFRPVLVLKGLMLRGSTLANSVRHALVALQFAILLVLIIAAGVVFQQNRYAATEELRLSTDQMLLVHMPECGSAFQTEVAALPGVTSVACTDLSLLPERRGITDAKSLSGREIGVSLSPVDFGFFQLFHISPLAGRLPDTAHPGDAILEQAPTDPLVGSANSQPSGEDKSPKIIPHYIINETARQALGFLSPQGAVGKPLNFGPDGDPPSGVIIGVVQDFSLYPLTEKVMPTAYWTETNIGIGQPGNSAALHVKLRGSDIPEALVAIDAAWKRHSLDPIDRIFLDDYVQQVEIAVLREGQAYAVFAGVAAFLGCLGLFGLSIASAERRTKEIGIRKAMGATNIQIVALLLWQFSRPVLWANVIAWPTAWWLMRRWLAGFVYHINLHAWLFFTAGAATLVIAIVTMAGQAVLVSRQKPILALRYE